VSFLYGASVYPICWLGVLMFQNTVCVLMSHRGLLDMSPFFVLHVAKILTHQGKKK